MVNTKHIISISLTSCIKHRFFYIKVIRLKNMQTKFHSHSKTTFKNYFQMPHHTFSIFSHTVGKKTDRYPDFRLGMYYNYCHFCISWQKRQERENDKSLWSLDTHTTVISTTSSTHSVIHTSTPSSIITPSSSHWSIIWSRSLSHHSSWWVIESSDFTFTTFEDLNISG